MPLKTIFLGRNGGMEECPHKGMRGAPGAGASMPRHAFSGDHRILRKLPLIFEFLRLTLGETCLSLNLLLQGWQHIDETIACSHHLFTGGL